MNELQVLDIIRQGFNVRELPVPEGMQRHEALSRWRGIARRIVDECNTDCRRAARAASIAGAMVTRGRTRL